MAGGSFVTRFLTGAVRESVGMTRTALSSTGVLKFAGYTGAGILGSAYLSNLAQQRQNYYGQAEYEARYKGGIETAAAFAPYVGAMSGGFSAFGMGPVGMVRRAGKTAAWITAPVVSGIRRGVGAIQPGLTELATADRWMTRMAGRPGLGMVGGGAMLMSAMFTVGGNVLANPGIAAGLVGLSVAAPALAGVHKFGGKGAVLGYAGGIAAAIGAGYYTSRNTAVATAEGQITDVRSNASNTVRKMDFNTAGLVQALHQMR